MRKLFTLFAATLFAFAANATTVVWNEAFLETIDIYHNYDTPEWNATINNSYGGITITAVAELPDGDLGIYEAGMFVDNAGGTFTFTSTIGNITKIEILGPTLYDPGNGLPVRNFAEENDIISKDWEIISPYMVVDKLTTAAVWEDTPAEVVEMICDTLNIIHMTSIVFTIEDPVLGQDIEIDLRTGQLGTGTSKYLIIGSTPTYYYVDEATTYNAFFEFDNFNGAQHGYTNLRAAIPLEAGNYRITLGACGFGNGAGTVKNEAQNSNLATFNQQIVASDKCYHQNTAENIVSTTFEVPTDQTIHVICGNYTPYFKLERLPDAEYTVTFVNNTEGVNGTVPSPIEVPVGNNITVPLNRTLYKEGYTLAAWTDGANNYAPGTLFGPTGNTTLTAVFTANTKGLLSATNEVVVKWDFGEANGAPSMDYEKSNGFLVAQATVSGETQDVKLDILASAENAKFFNSGRNDQWAQANTGTALLFPSKADATVEVKAYYQPLSNLLVDMQAATLEIGSEGNYVSTFDAAPILEGESRFSVIANNYLSYLQVTLPASDPTALDNTTADTKAVKRIVNGQLVIEKNGKFYNALGAEVK